MKKITIFLIVVFFLLSFMGISYSNEENLKYGELWNSFSRIQKPTYLLGVHHGIREGISKCIDSYHSYFSENEKEGLKQMDIIGLDCLYEYLTLSSLFDLSIISNVVDDFYEDPANTYISIPVIYLLAIRRLKGEDIESLLQKARREVLE